MNNTVVNSRPCQASDYFLAFVSRLTQVLCNRHKQHHVFGLLICSAALLTLSLPIQANSQSNHAALKQVQEEISEKSALIKDKENQKQILQSRLKRIEKSVAETSKKVFKLKQSIQDQQGQLKDLQIEQKALNLQKREQEKIISEQINTSYRLGREKKIKMLLNQEDPSQLSRMLIYSDYFNKARLESIKQYQQTVTRIEQIKPGIEKKTKQLLKDKDALVAEQKSLKKEYAKRGDLLKVMSKEIQSEKSKLKQLQEDQKRLEELLKQVEVAVNKIELPSDATPFKKMKRKLPWPVQGSYDRRFGKKNQGTSMRWEGNAFYAKLGTEVKAIHHGRVIFSDWFRGKGFLLIIDHGDGYMSLYAHNQSLLRDTGDWVSQGESIATLGDTGGLDHAELYFEIRHHGKPQNPKNWFKKR